MFVSFLLFYYFPMLATLIPLWWRGSPDWLELIGGINCKRFAPEAPNKSDSWTKKIQIHLSPHIFHLFLLPFFSRLPKLSEKVFLRRASSGLASLQTALHATTRKIWQANRKLVWWVVVFLHFDVKEAPPCMTNKDRTFFLWKSSSFNS